MTAATPPVVLAHQMVRVDGVELGGVFIPLDVLISAGGKDGARGMSTEQSAALLAAGLIEPSTPIRFSPAGYAYNRAAVDAYVASAKDGDDD